MESSNDGSLKSGIEIVPDEVSYPVTLRAPVAWHVLDRLLQTKEEIKRDGEYEKGKALKLADLDTIISKFGNEFDITTHPHDLPPSIKIGLSDHEMKSVRKYAQWSSYGDYPGTKAHEFMMEEVKDSFAKAKPVSHHVRDGVSQISRGFARIRNRISPKDK